MKNEDLLWMHLRDLPYFRGLLRAKEAVFYRDIPLHPPTLDLGCGDGHFASNAFQRTLEVGLDCDFSVLQEAAGYRAYQYRIQSNGCHLPFPTAYFCSVVSNSVLEHVCDVDAMLREIARVLKQGSRFVFSVPNHLFLPKLSIGRFFDKVGLRWLGNGYRAAFNRISRHHHCDSVEVWRNRLEWAGYEIEQYWHYFSPEALAVLEWGHFFEFPSLVCKWLFGRWIIAPFRWNLALTRGLVEPHYNEPVPQPEGVYTFYITRLRGQIHQLVDDDEGKRTTRTKRIRLPQGEVNPLEGSRA
ncbi:MAG: class I SAM-dependent methyltransferase [Chloroflexota bacterium]